MDTCKLTELCRIQYGYAFDSASFTEDASFPPLVRIRDVKRGFSETYYSGNYSEEYIVRRGDILIGMDGEFNIARWQSEPALLNQRVCKIIPNQQVDGSYLLFALTKILKKIEDKTAFVTVKHLSAKELNKIELRIPNYEQQMQISSTLEKALSILSRRQYQLAKLDELVKCRFVELFGEPLALKAKWKTTSFGSEFEIFSGGTPSTSVSEYWDNGTIPWIGSNMCQDVILSSTDGKYITEEGFNNSSAKWAHAGYVIVALVGATIGKTALLSVSTTTNQNVASINVPSNINYTPEYIYMLMRFLYPKFMDLGNGGFKMANLGFIRQLPLPTPPIGLQREYSAFMHRIDKLRFVIQQSLDEAQKLFDSLMQEYFD